ncbi:MAG: glucan 1,4-alpha-glucosidase, partial [Verrucomicrobiae bacterium]|nr:glucan 1,4-alpha-glucosidase [Verrucomicrobiae bacterium]
RGDLEAAERLRATVEAFSRHTGLLPEQVWDADDLPGKELLLGQPSGSAMPLVWAHAEYVKLVRSLADHAVFDRPVASAERYDRPERSQG